MQTRVAFFLLFQRNDLKRGVLLWEATNVRFLCDWDNDLVYAYGKHLSAKVRL